MKRFTAGLYAACMAGGLAAGGAMPALGADVSAEISRFKFTPNVIEIKAGDTVTWTNKDGVRHSVTANSASGPDTGLFGKDEKRSLTFETPLEMDFHCKLHPSMKGRVIVR